MTEPGRGGATGGGDPDGESADPSSALNEDERSRERARYRELLEELRTIIPGVQVLLAFLLTTPYATRFDELDRLGLVLYGVAVGSAAVATVLMLAPASYHRLTRLSRERDVHRKERIEFSSYMMVSGMAFLLISIVTAVLLVTQFVFNLPLGLIMSVLVAAVAGVCWYVVPLVRRPKS